MYTLYMEKGPIVVEPSQQNSISLKCYYYAMAKLPPALEIFVISSLNFAIVSFARVNFSFKSITSSLILLRASIISFIVDSFNASTAGMNLIELNCHRINPR